MSLPRVDSYDTNPEESSLLLPDEVVMDMLPDGKVSTQGLGLLDSKKKDLIRIIRVTDTTLGLYEPLYIYSPRTYAESLRPIAPHLSVQAILVCRVTDQTQSIIKDLQEQYPYDMRVGPKDYQVGDTLMIMNRRV